MIANYDDDPYGVYEDDDDPYGVYASNKTSQQNSLDDDDPYGIYDEEPDEGIIAKGLKTARVTAENALPLLGKGFIGLPEAAAGLYDISQIPSNLIGKGLDTAARKIMPKMMANVPEYQPTSAAKLIEPVLAEPKRYYEEKLTPEFKAGMEDFSQSKGAWEKIKAVGRNPFIATGTIIESLPASMIPSGIGGRLAASGLLSSALKKKGIDAGTVAAKEFARKFFTDPKTIAKLTAIGGAIEGAVTTGQLQAQYEQGGMEDLEAAKYSIPAGATTALISILTSKIPGFKDSDAEALLASAGNSATRKTLLETGKGIAKTMFKEGTLEELPQSVQEQIWQNLAEKRPWNEGLDQAGIMGWLAGTGQGGGMALGAAGIDYISAQPNKPIDILKPPPLPNEFTPDPTPDEKKNLEIWNRVENNKKILGRDITPEEFQAIVKEVNEQPVNGPVDILKPKPDIVGPRPGTFGYKEQGDLSTQPLGIPTGAPRSAEESAFAPETREEEGQRILTNLRPNITEDIGRYYAMQDQYLVNLANRMFSGEKFDLKDMDKADLRQLTLLVGPDFIEAQKGETPIPLRESRGLVTTQPAIQPPIEPVIEQQKALPPPPTDIGPEGEGQFAPPIRGPLSEGTGPVIPMGQLAKGDNPDSYTGEELRQIAKDNGIELPKRLMKKSDMIELIKKGSKTEEKPVNVPSKPISKPASEVNVGSNPDEAFNFRDWVNRTGGLNLNDQTYKGEINDIRWDIREDGRKVPRKGFPQGIWRNEGRGLDERVLQAIDHGWLPEGSTEQDFIDLLENNPSYKDKWSRVGSGNFEIDTEAEQEYINNQETAFKEFENDGWTYSELRDAEEEAIRREEKAFKAEIEQHSLTPDELEELFRPAQKVTTQKEIGNVPQETLPTELKSTVPEISTFKKGDIIEGENVRYDGEWEGVGHQWTDLTKGQESSFMTKNPTKEEALAEVANVRKRYQNETAEEKQAKVELDKELESKPKKSIFKKAKPTPPPEVKTGQGKEQPPKAEVKGKEKGEGGIVFKTGKLVTFPYLRNLEKSPNMGERFGQHIEPKGKYVIHNYTKDDYLIKNFPDKYEMGEMTFKNPLVVDIVEPLDHKRILSDKYGKKGEALSKAIVKDGYDGIVTKYKDGSTGEIIDLSKYVTSPAPQSPKQESPKQESPKQTPGKVYLDKGGVKPFFEYREIKKGLAKGKIEVTLTNGKKVTVNPERIREYPSETPSMDKPAFLKEGEEKNLYIGHNLTAENLKHADKMGGLAVPSLAVANKDMPLTGFGEITLLTTPDIIENRDTRTVNADMYSPRYPRITGKIDEKEKTKFIEELESSRKEIDGESLYSALESVKERGVVDGLRYNNVLKYAFLKEKGNAPEIIYAKEKDFPDNLKKYRGSDIDLRKSPNFKKDVQKALEDRNIDTKLNDINRKFEWFVDNYANEIEGYKPVEKIADRYAMSNKLYDLFTDTELQNEFELWLDNKYSKLISEEKIFDGFTYSGKKRYLDHNLDNVVKVMKRDMKEGEGFNYGVPSIRSKAAKQFKTIKSIQKDRNKIISTVEMDKVKEEVNTEFDNLLKEIAPYSPYSKEFRYGDIVSEHFKEAAKKGFNFVNRTYYEGDLPSELVQKANDFLQKLRDLPSEYFEAKVKRAMNLNEFVSAVVPEGTSKDTIDLLNKHGITDIRYYKKSDEKDRARAINQVKNDVFFLKEGDTSIEAPAGKSIGRLTVKGVQNIVNRVKEKFPNIGNVNVIEKQADIPDEIFGDKNRDEVGKVFAYYNPADDSINIVAENMKNMDSVINAMIHEGIGHRGVDAILSKDQRKRLFYMVQKDYRNSEIGKKIVKDYELNLENEGDQVTFAREVIAHMATSEPKATLLDRVISFIKQAIRNMGFTLKLTDAEIRNLLRQSAEFAKQSPTETSTGEKPAFSLSKEDQSKLDTMFEKYDVALGKITKESKLAKRVREETEEAGIPGEFENLVDYETRPEWMKDQKDKAAKVLNSDYELAKKIAMGEAEPPIDIMWASIYNAVKRRAEAERDWDTLYDIGAFSEVPEKLSKFGQQIKAADESDPDDPLRAMRDVEADRKEKNKKQGKKVVSIQKVKELKRKLAEAEEKLKQYENKPDVEKSEAGVDSFIKNTPKSILRKGSSKSITDKLKALASENQDLSDMTSDIQELARYFISKGITARGPLVEAVYGVIKDIIPGVTLRETQDAISGYGKFRPLSKDEISAKLRDLKGQMQQVSKLEDMQQGMAPLKTGFERRIPSDEERRLIQQVEEMKKELGIETIDPEKQLKSALDSVKTRLSNQIKDLEYQIETREKIVKKRIGLKYDVEAENLKKRRDELRAQFDELFGKPALSEDQRIQMAIRAVNKSIEEYTRRINDNDLTPAAKRTPAQSEELNKLRETRDELKAKVKELRDLAKPKKTAEEIALQRLKTRLTNETKKLTEKLETLDFEKTQKGETVLDPEAKKLKEERDTIKEAYNAAVESAGIVTREEADRLMELSEAMKEAREEMEAGGDRFKYGAAKVAFLRFIDHLKGSDKTIKTLLKDEWAEVKAAWKDNKPSAFTKSAKDIIQAISDLSISLMASMDNSFLGRQGLNTLLTHPTVWAPAAKKSFVDIYRSMVSKHGGQMVRDAVMSDAYSRPNYINGDYNTAKLIPKSEEQFPTSIPERIPFLGRAFKASENAFLNSGVRMRINTYDLLKNIAEAQGVDTSAKEWIQETGKLINSVTARGDLGKMGSGGPLRLIFWAPKMLWGNVNVLTAHFSGAGLKTPFARQQARKNLIKIVGFTVLAAAIIDGLGRAFGKDDVIEWNPLSSDFMKVKINNTRYDLTGGKASIVTLVARALTFRTKSTRTKKIEKLNSGRYWAKTLLDVIIDFMANKSAPVTTTAIDIARGRNFNYEKPGIGNTAYNLATPIGVQNFVETMQRDNKNIPVEEIAGNILDIVGINADTYDTEAEQRKKYRELRRESK